MKRVYIDMDNVLVEWIQFGTDPFRDWEAVLKYLNA